VAFHMKVGETINDYLGHTFIFVDNMKVNGENESDMIIAKNLLWSMSLEIQLSDIFN